MATLNVLKRAVHKALADGRVTSTEAAGVARRARQGGVSRVERRFLSSAVRAQVDPFDAGAQSRLHAVGARWTATGNDPWGSREPGQRGGDGVFERAPEATSRGRCCESVPRRALALLVRVHPAVVVPHGGVTDLLNVLVVQVRADGRGHERHRARE